MEENQTESVRAAAAEARVVRRLVPLDESRDRVEPPCVEEVLRRVGTRAPSDEVRARRRPRQKFNPQRLRRQTGGMPAGSGQWADVTNGHAHLVSPSKFLFWVGNRRQSPANFRGFRNRRVPKTKTYPRSLFPLSERDAKYVSRCFGPRSLDARRVASRQSFARVRGTYAVALNQFLRKE